MTATAKCIALLESFHILFGSNYESIIGYNRLIRDPFLILAKI
ncbi:hypothetical protein D1BOALGB6SA_9156 [Olavius sp. associated proteobacterium Delta 1]|nr:hypothetical protein D1BOALGB6SA_9156 [Olavius sp. associated proteobacterium Delta 1]